MRHIHLTHADYFREHGPDAFLTANGYPPIPLLDYDGLRSVLAGDPAA
jgi:hypothetical protein